MMTQHITFHVRSLTGAQALQQRLTFSGMLLHSEIVEPAFSDSFPLPRTSPDSARDFIVTVTDDIATAARAALFALLLNNRPTIYSVTIADETRLVEHITENWWNERFVRCFRNPVLLDHQVGGR